MENVWKGWRGKSKNVREDRDDTNSWENILEKIERAIEREMPRWMITFIDENQVGWEDDSLEADMTEVEARLEVK